MSQKQQNVQYVKLDQIVADENQPRKNFNPERIAELEKSIKRYGIMNPLLVEKVGNKYLLVDGERRYRASQQMGLAEVPVIVSEPLDGTDRLIKQFHVQEQHEGWTALEKAVAVIKLADSLKVGLPTLADMLSLPPRTIQEYTALGKVLEKKEFIKQEISVHYSGDIVSVVTFAKTMYRKIDAEFTEEMQRGLEKAIITHIKRGDIKTQRDVTRLKDAMRVDPKSIEKFINNPKMTSQKLFLESNAKVAYYFRNAVQLSYNLSTSIRNGIPLGMEKLFKEDEDSTAYNALKMAHTELTKLLNKVSRVETMK